MSSEDMVRCINEIVAPYNLHAELFPDVVKRVCVRGDARAYLPVINLIGPGPLPDYDILEKLSTKITNEFDVGGVTIQVALKDENC